MWGAQGGGMFTPEMMQAASSMMSSMTPEDMAAMTAMAGSMGAAGGPCEHSHPFLPSFLRSPSFVGVHCH